ncbi:hexokinase-domain-containing protein [Phlyctochytrium arcticum]|nr:hexokinase-domain-containing protein [Phlyctochytrium arcticum]
MDVPLFLFGLTTGVSLTAASQYLMNSFLGRYRATTPTGNRNDPSTPILPPSPTSPVGGGYYGTGTLARLDREFTVSSRQLQTMVRHLVNEMKKGLAQDGHTLKMIPSFVVSRPTGTESGSYLALDLGGSNFRVCLVTLEGQGRTRVRQTKHLVSEELKTGPGEQLFDFFAECIRKFLTDLNMDLKEQRSLGFTFSFPIQQHAVNSGTLMQWNKGFGCSGVLNKDVVDLLSKSLKKAGINIKVTALVNDTVGTLVSYAYRDPQTYVGVIFGTGTNAAYVERIEEIPKWTGPIPKSGEMIVNTEWGAYDEASVLPITSYDLALDRSSSNPRKQIFEKLISGMYLGEIVRYVLLELVSTGELFRGHTSKVLQTPYAFETAYMSRIERDHTLELSDTKAVLEDMVGLPSSTTTVEDRRIVKHVCELVGIRAARLSAAGVAAIVTKMNRWDACTVAIDGTLFERYPHFQNRMRDALRELLGIMAENIVLEQARDGSGEGAALIAALHHDD